MAGVFNVGFLSPPQLKKQLKQRKHCKKHFCLVVGLEKWCLEKGTAKEIEKLRADPAKHFTRAIQRRN